MPKLLRVPNNNLQLARRASIPVEEKISPRDCSGDRLYLRILAHSRNVGLRVGLAILTTALFSLSTWAATQKVLYSFNGSDGATPLAGLVFDGAGNLYGTTSAGGTSNHGTVFELSPDGSGGWRHSVLYRFSGPDGAKPYAGLIFDGAGNLYGTTTEGGMFGSGVVFKLSPNGGGGWTESALYSFGDAPDGSFPAASLVFDGTRVLYGTTKYGGSLGEGTVFQLSFDGSNWTEKVLHSFGRDGRERDGRRPEASLILDAAGNLYGTTLEGGNFLGGTVFQLTPGAGGSWTETVLFNFHLPDGKLRSSLIFDAAGNLYGTAFGADPQSPRGKGMVFRLNRSAGWTQTVLHMFVGTDGARPMAGLIFDGAGNLYGTTAQGGGSMNSGTAFVLQPNLQGGYTESLLHSFTGSDGSSPEAGLIRDAAGNLYGTTRFGGSDRRGTVFQIMP